MGQTEERRVASLRNREVIWDISKISRLESKFKKKDTTQESHQKDNKTDLVYRQHRMHL